MRSGVDGNRVTGLNGYRLWLLNKKHSGRMYVSDSSKRL